jgi:hypothetical protein
MVYTRKTEKALNVELHKVSMVISERFDKKSVISSGPDNADTGELAVP